MLSIKDSLIQRHKKVESKRMEKDTPCKSNQKRTGVAVLVNKK